MSKLDVMGILGIAVAVAIVVWIVAAVVDPDAFEPACALHLPNTRRSPATQCSLGATLTIESGVAVCRCPETAVAR